MREPPGMSMRRRPRAIRPSELELMRAVGRRLLLYRRRAKLTAADVAEAAGLSQQTIYNIENARVAVDVAQLSAIAARLGVSVCTVLCNGDDQAERAEAVQHPESPTPPN